ncbi:MAG: glycosyltransferase family A protein [Candidatus Magasanikbacteria bacterium]|nr:glycosyltransferase family A protein [Candidatus Magasanikbacteria bacterium]
MKEIRTAARSNLAVIVVTHDEPKVLGAIRSIIDNQADVRRVYIIDAGTTKPSARRALHLGYVALASSGVEFVRIELGNVAPAISRAVAYGRVLEDLDIDLVTCLDADDAYGNGYLASMRQTYMQHGGEVDLIIPSHIRQIRDSDQKRETISQTIPKVPKNLDVPSDELVGAWVCLTRVGATFGVATHAIRTFGSFHQEDTHDEWVVLFCRWAGLGARMRHFDVQPKHSYQYFLHDAGDQHSGRREDHSARRAEAAVHGFQQAAGILRTRSSAPQLQP